MKKVLFFAVAAAMLAACSNTDELALQSVQTNDAQGTPVNFDVYAGRTATRAGSPGNDGTNYGVTTASLQNGAHKEGFGVFGFYTNNDLYDTNSSIPNFMYNQPVTYKSGSWTYEPVKYWPNEFGNTAESDDVDYLTFFAYAPFIDVTYNTGVPVAKTIVATVTDPENEITEADALKLLGYDDKAAYNDAMAKAAGYADFAAYQTANPGADFDALLQTALNEQVQKLNITQLNKNTQSGDPIVKYVVDTKPATSVDLLWGVANANNGYEGEHGETIADGSPFVNLTKQNNVTKKINWYFKHALARINVQIVNAVDAVTAADYDPSTSADWGTEGDGTTVEDKLSGIFLRSIAFNGFALKGALNLHSEPVATVDDAKPYWMAYDGTNELQFETVVFHDGLKDGKEGTTNNIQKSEGVSALNPVLLQASSETGTGKLEDQEGADDKCAGIPTSYVNLFAGAKNVTDPIYVIPSGEPLDITVTYDIETIDENLADMLSDNINHGSAIQNVISKTDILSALTTVQTIEAGYSYVIKIIIGTESVKFDVDVTPWIDGPGSPSEIELPENN